MSIQRQYAEFAVGLSFDDLPVEVVDHAKKLLVDIIANAIGGYAWMESGEVVLEATERLNRDNDGATVLATGERMAPEWATFANGTMAHSLDYDNHHAKGVIHAGSSVVTSALAAAEENAASGRDLLTAIVVGYEISTRLAMACNPFSSHEMGFHPTGTCGVFGATALVSKLRGASVEEIENALGINGSQASGSMQYDLNGAWNKRSHPGFATHSAFIAATLASEGFLGSAEVIEGEDGFLRGYSLRPKMERATEGLGESWETLEVAIKPFPLCRYTHMTIDQLVGLANEENLDPASVESIHIELPTYGVNLVGSPIEQKRNPTSAVEAQFSAPFAAALALTHRAAGMDLFRSVVDARVPDEMRRLMSLTTVESASDLDALHPELWPGRATLIAAGKEHTRYGEHIKGEKENPMSWDEVAAKLTELSPKHGHAARQSVVDVARNLENRTVDDLLQRLRG
ncbi:MAG: MmgE/PrpD family protein [Nitriliruptorales bacterium]|nr:MmgE/PrpD family protein [Nitriliruptorales bacterium]